MKDDNNNPSLSSDSREDADADLFGVTPLPPPGSEIPRLTEIPLTRAELRQRRIRRIVFLFLGVSSVALLVFFGIRAIHDYSVEQSTLRAGDTGHKSDCLDALELLAGDDSDEAVAMRARIATILAIEGYEKYAEKAAQWLDEIHPERAAHEMHIAEVYRALDEGRVQDAAEHASRLRAAGTYTAEIAYARAVAAFSLGNTELALASARLAHENRPSAPRYAAFYALLLAMQGSIDQGLALLAGASPATAVHLARARIRLDARSELNRVSTELRSVALADPSPAQQRWALLLEARLLAERGQVAKARAKALTLVKEQPNDKSPTERSGQDREAFGIMLAETLMRSRAPSQASEVMAELQIEISTDPTREAQIRAMIFSAQGRFSEAREVLEAAADNARTRLVRADLAHSTGQLEAAAELYRAAQGTDSTALYASVGLGLLELQRGDPQAAIAQLSRALEIDPCHPVVVEALVRAHFERDELDAAEELVRTSLEAYPESQLLLGARAQVQIRRGQWIDALASLQQALQIDAADAGLQATRGDVAWQLGKYDDARQAYLASLEVDARQSDALLGLLELQLHLEEVDQAKETLERLRAAGIRTVRSEILRARTLVLDLQGHRGALAIRSSFRLARKPELWFWLGHLKMQSEEYLDASQAFERAKSNQTLALEARLRSVIAQALGRLAGPAERKMEAIVDDLEVNALDVGVKALLLAARARVQLANRNRARAVILARQAIALDPRCAEAHWVLADYMVAVDRDPRPALESSLEGYYPPIVAYARLGLEGEPTPQRCAMVQTYRRAAPKGQLASRAFDRFRACR